MKCVNCGAPLPKGSTGRRKYCDGACRAQYNRGVKDPTIRQKAKIPPSNGTGDKELDDIIFMKVEASIRNTMLKELYDRRREQGRREGIEEAEQWKEERVLDASTAKEVGDFLAAKYNPSRARRG